MAQLYRKVIAFLAENKYRMQNQILLEYIVDIWIKDVGFTFKALYAKIDAL